MATAYKIHLTPEQTGVVPFKAQNQEMAEKVSKLLQDNHENHHIFFNEAGFHNHIVHHLLTLYGLGCPAELLEKHYKHNSEYQLPPKKTEQSVAQNLNDPEVWKKNLDKKDQYSNFLTFFSEEIEKKGWQNVLNEYLFDGSERAEDMLVRMFAGFLHPIIHLGFGIEFQQPAIIAEALAQAAAHDAWIGDFFLRAELAAKTKGRIDKSLGSLLDNIHDDKKLSTAAHWDDSNKIRDGIIARAGEEIVQYASQFVASPDMLKEKTAEMVNAALWYTAAAQHPPKKVKFDFYYMHSVNASIFWQTFNAQPWLSTPNKVRLLEWKARLDLAMYASRRSPKLYEEEITHYEPQVPEKADWSGVFARFFDRQDDGHAVKLGRAVANAEKQTKEFEDRAWVKIRGPQFLQIGNMVIDSVENMQPDEASWVRSAGFDEAWDEFPDRPKKSSL